MALSTSDAPLAYDIVSAGEEIGKKKVV